MPTPPTYTSWKITCRSVADADALRRWLSARIDLDRVLTDTIRVAPGGVEQVQTVQYRLGDYFASIRLLPDAKVNPTAFRLVFQRRPDAGRFWKDLMVNVLQEIKGTSEEASIEVEPKEGVTAESGFRMQTTIYSADQIRRLIEATAESDNIDAKGPLSWDGAADSASLAKDIAAFANSRDGGVIVLGKSEPEAGKFTYDGLSDVQAQSFDTTKVGDWINSRFAPPIRFACHRHEYLGKLLIVITITEFEDVPHICTKSFQDPTDGKTYLLRQGAIYVRKPNASSAPLASVDELRTLVGLATAKRSHELLSMFESMIKGRPLVRPPNDNELFDEEYHRILAGLGKSFQEVLDAGAWVLRAHPGTYHAQRWKTLEELEAAIQRRAVRVRNEFPPHYRGVHKREWGIASDVSGDVWTLASSGQFLSAKPYFENARSYQPNWVAISGQPPPNLREAQWLDLKASLFQICEMFSFLTRLVEEYPHAETVFFQLRATNLAGRILATTDFNVWFHPSEPCRASTFDFSKEMLVTELRADWETICADAMKEFVDFFPGYQRVNVQTMTGWIEKFKRREF